MKTSARLAAVACAAIAACGPDTSGPLPGSQDSRAEGGTAIVVSTAGRITLDVAGERITLAGVTSPEHHHCGHPTVDTRVHEIVDGRTATIDRRKRRSDGATEAYLDIDGQDLGARLVTEGLVTALTDGQPGYTPHPKETQYRQAATGSTDPCTGLQERR